MRPLRSLVVYPGIRRDLRALVATSPLLGCGNELGTDFAKPVFGFYVPSLDVADWTRRVAPIRVGPQTGVKKTNQAVLNCGDEDRGGKFAWCTARHQPRYIPGVLGGVGVGPESVEHQRNGVDVPRFGRPHYDGIHADIIAPDKSRLPRSGRRY